MTVLVFLQAMESPSDRARFESLYLAYRGLMFQVANRILRNDQDAEDAVHQAFCALAEHAAVIPESLGPRARALAATVAERKAIDLYRAKRRHPTADLDELPLKYYNGYGNGEIAAFLDTTQENVRQIIFRAKGKLAAELAERGETV